MNGVEEEKKKWGESHTTRKTTKLIRPKHKKNQTSNKTNQPLLQKTTSKNVGKRAEVEEKSGVGESGKKV